MRYPDEFIEEVRGRNDIVDVLSGYIKLTRRGSHFIGLCPFHNEKTPSFSVNQTRQMYHCFGCGVSGDVFGFVMEYDNLGFNEAVKALAERANIPLPDIKNSEEDGKNARFRAEMYRIQKDAATYYYWRLHTSAGKDAYKYLKNRGLSDETIKSFGLGFSDKGKSGLYAYLKEKGASDAILKESGLFTTDAKGQLKDKFWNRVMFPIMDVNKRVIGFGGRVMGDGLPKYMNSPDTKLFDKSKNLYGLYAARTARKGNIILCEGYMDVISMHQYGFTNAAASLGTSLTTAQAGLLHRYTDEVLLMYDSDAAGKKAAVRAIGILRNAGINARVVDLSPFKDPDELLKAKGAEELSGRLKKAENGFLFEVRMKKEEYDISDPAGKSAFHKEIAKMLFVFPDEIERNNYIESVCSLYAINPEALKKEVSRLAVKGQVTETVQKKSESLAASRSSKNTEEKKVPSYAAEKSLLACVFERPELISKISGIVSADDFADSFLRKLAERLFEEAGKGSFVPVRFLNAYEDSSERALVSEIMTRQSGDTDEADASKHLVRCAAAVKEAYLTRRRDETSGADLAALQKLFEEKKKLEKFIVTELSV